MLLKEGWKHALIQAKNNKKTSCIDTSNFFLLQHMP